MSHNFKQNTLVFESIKVGQKSSFERVITKEDVKIFTNLTGDYNPLHTDETYAAMTDMKGTIVHGMLAGSLFSTLVGMHLPGKYSLYLSQDIQFKKPIRPGEKLIVTGTIKEKVLALNIVEMETNIRDAEGTLLLSGTARVKVLR